MVARAPRWLAVGFIALAYLVAIAADPIKHFKRVRNIVTVLTTALLWWHQHEIHLPSAILQTRSRSRLADRGGRAWAFGAQGCRCGSWRRPLIRRPLASGVVVGGAIALRPNGHGWRTPRRCCSSPDGCARGARQAVFILVNSDCRPRRHEYYSRVAAATLPPPASVGRR
jgi:hypothetical protein